MTNKEKLSQEEAFNIAFLPIFAPKQKAELITDCEGDEAERQITKQGIGLGSSCALVKTDADLSEHVRADQNTRNEICRYSGKTHLFRQTREQKSRKKRDGKC